MPNAWCVLGIGRVHNFNSVPRLGPVSYPMWSSVTISEFWFQQEGGPEAS